MENVEDETLVLSKHLQVYSSRMYDNVYFHGNSLCKATKGLEQQ